MQLGLIGTGTMGNRFGPKLLSAGHSLTVHDLRREAATALCEAGAQWADSPDAVARASEVVITSLPGPTAVEKVMFGQAHGLLDAMRPGTTYVDMSTSTPWLAREIAEACQAKGISALDAPLSSGGVFITVGGDPAVFERCRPVLDAVGEQVSFVGGPGMGQVFKLVRQHVSFSTFLVEAEALLIGAKAGADLQAMSQFIGGSVGHSDFQARTLASLFERDFGAPGTATATLDIVSKDISLAVELARQVQAPASIGLAVADVLQRGQAEGWGSYNFWAAVQVLEQMAHGELRSSGPPANVGV